LESIITKAVASNGKKWAQQEQKQKHKNKRKRNLAHIHIPKYILDVVYT
jgi:hypothetical protein